MHFKDYIYLYLEQFWFWLLFNGAQVSWCDNADSLFEEDSSGIINMCDDNLLKHRELHGLLSAVELLYIYQTEISASRSSRKARWWTWIYYSNFNLQGCVTCDNIVLPQILERQGNIFVGQSDTISTTEHFVKVRKKNLPLSVLLSSSN